MMSVENITFYPAKNASLNITQLEPLALFASGLPAKTIAHQLGKAKPTVVHHLNAARAYYHGKNTTHAVAIAIHIGDLKRKFISSHSAAKRLSATAFGVLACLVCLQDTPFFGVDDYELTRHNRGERQTQNNRITRRNRDNELDTIHV